MTTRPPSIDEIIVGTTELGVGEFENVRLESDSDVSRDITRTQSFDRFLSDSVERDVDRTETATRLMSDTLFRDVSRTETATRLLTDDTVLRDIERTQSFERLMADADASRDITRTQSFDRQLSPTLFRDIERSVMRMRLLAEDSTVLRRRLDFEGYSRDVQIMEEFADEWAHEEYASILLQLIQRGDEEERNL